ncbi:RICIN domain-containing protein [Streptomyces sp. SID4948]|nr:RICIN domain-containing protein [Streptomyces sp. SID4948]
MGAASGRCLDVAGGTDTPGTVLQIWDCDGQAGQRTVWDGSLRRQ